MADRLNFPTFREVFLLSNVMKQNLKNIRSWEESQRPREKFLLRGAQAMSTEELIAIIIGSGTKEKNAVELSREVLDACDNDLSRMALLTFEDLRKFGGVGVCKAVSLMTVFELSRRYQSQSARPLPQIYSSASAYQTMAPLLRDISHEECWIMYLNKGNRLIAKEKISSGGISATVMDIKMIIKRAVGKLASSIILIHNHPGGNRKPGKDDIIQTRKLVEAARLCDISVTDHIIIAGGNYYSFADEGTL